MITTVTLADTSIWLHNFLSFLWWEHLNSLSNFKVYDTVLLTINMMLYQIPELTHLLSSSLCTLCCGPFWVEFCVWCEVQIRIHFLILCIHSCTSAICWKNHSLSIEVSLHLFVKNQMPVCIYIPKLYSFPLTHLFLHQHHIIFIAAFTHLKIRWHRPSAFILLFKLFWLF